MSEPQFVFDRRALRRHRERAAASLAAHDFLFREVADRLVERLDDVRRDFAVAADLGCRSGFLSERLAERGIETIIAADLSPAMARSAPRRARGGARLHAIVADEEWLPFAESSLDLVTSCLSLHFVNDLPGALAQIRRALKPDGLFLAAMLGGGTLAELREALVEAELAETGGASPRVSPFAGVQDAGALLQRAGFALPVIDCDTITVTYDGAMDLMRDLRGMGESNAVLERVKHFTRRSTLARAAAIYAHRFADKAGRIPATFEVISLTGWAPHASQPKALKPGSAASRLAQALGAVEQAAGDKAAPRR